MRGRFDRQHAGLHRSAPIFTTLLLILGCYEKNESGKYTPPQLCGNGDIDPGEDCDDGNESSGDGCGECAVEYAFECEGNPSVCTVPCGDGKPFGAGCDDGNTDNGDGCSATCEQEPYFSCAGTPSVCVPVCGDAAVRGTEPCDDGNEQSGDGCDSACQLEPLWACSGDPSVCVGICGDGAVRAEGCDDGNAMPGDGCNASCEVEAGFFCAGDPSVCLPLCGDGHILGSEGCDDGNADSGDGCDATCAYEEGFTCSGEPTVCSSNCGDAERQGAEDCDDGNTSGGDGCSATCTFEATCGNSSLEPGESCDDGGVLSLDGCSSTCQVEAGTVCGDATDLTIEATPDSSGFSVLHAGTTAGGTTEMVAPTCAPNASAVTAVYRYTTHAPARLNISVNQSNPGLSSAVVWTHLDCLDPIEELFCSNSNTNGPPGTLAHYETQVLPAGTTAFVAVASNTSDETGAFELAIDEDRYVVLDEAGTCDAPLTLDSGHYLGSATPQAELVAATCFSGGTQSIQAIELPIRSDLDIEIFPQSDSEDIRLALISETCAGIEYACLNNGGSGEPETFNAVNLSQGTYYLIVEAPASGAYGLDLHQTAVIYPGSPCDPDSTTERCEDESECLQTSTGTVCKQRNILFSDPFTASLGDVVIGDSLTDGFSWSYCDPNAGCSIEGAPGNTTGSDSSGAFALVLDQFDVSMSGETMRTTELNATNTSTAVYLSFYHDFKHYPGTTDAGYVRISTNDGASWTDLSSYTSSTSGHVLIDITDTLAGKKGIIEFAYYDSTAGGDPWAKGWAIDDVMVYGF